MTIPKFMQEVQIRWSDMDANGHLRHSVYYDYGAMARIDILRSQGIGMEFMSKHKIGPILFREECTFRKEIKAGDVIYIHSQLSALRKDGSRFSIRHDLKKADILCSTIQIDGAWLDTEKRKLTVPPKEIRAAFSQWPQTDDFERK